MKIVPANQNDFPLLAQFIRPYEEKCIFLASQIRRKSDHIFIIKKNGDKNNDDKKLSPGKTLSPGKKSDILGVFYLDLSLFHCIPNPEYLNWDEILPFIKNTISSASPNPKSKVKCVSGEAKSTEFFVNILKDFQGQPYQINHYKLMTADHVQNPPEELANDDKIIRCTEADKDLLFPIQKKYLTEEVAPFGKTVSDAEVSLGLKQTLKNQLCLALYTDGQIAAKANTNAIGINWIQLGGVYTHPLYRRNGYAWHLVSAICRRAEKAEKKSALFVKDINVPAMELYKKSGFEDSGLYEIAYF